MTPLLAREPYSAAAAAPFTTSTWSMSPGAMSERLLRERRAATAGVGAEAHERLGVVLHDHAVHDDQRLGAPEDGAGAAEPDAHAAARLAIVLADHGADDLALERLVHRLGGWRVVDLLAGHGSDGAAHLAALRRSAGARHDHFIQLDRVGLQRDRADVHVARRAQRDGADDARVSEVRDLKLVSAGSDSAANAELSLVVGRRAELGTDEEDRGARYRLQ